MSLFIFRNELGEIKRLAKPQLKPQALNNLIQRKHIVSAILCL